MFPTVARQYRMNGASRNRIPERSFWRIFDLENAVYLWLFGGSWIIESMTNYLLGFYYFSNSRNPVWWLPSWRSVLVRKEKIFLSEKQLVRPCGYSTPARPVCNDRVLSIRVDLHTNYFRWKKKLLHFMITLEIPETGLDIFIARLTSEYFLVVRKKIGLRSLAHSPEYSRKDICLIK